MAVPGLDVLDYYHGLLPREDLPLLLAKEGDYLLRSTQVKTGEERRTILSLAYQDKKIKLGHYVITQEKEPPNLFTIDKTISKATIDELVQEYKSRRVPLKKEIPNTILINAINRPSWELRADNVITGRKLGEGEFGDVHQGKLRLRDREVDVAIKVARKDIISKEKIKEDAAWGIEYLHHKHIIHRDLAARNCLIVRVNEEYLVKISDFGLSRDGDAYVMKTVRKVPIRWLAPETIQTFTYTPKSDVWAYGVLVWEVMTNGDEPYAGEPNPQIKQKIVAGELLQFPSLANQEIVSLIKQHCWDKDKDRRYSMTEVAQKLESLNNRQPPPVQEEDNTPDNQRHIQDQEGRDKQQKKKKKRKLFSFSVFRGLRPKWTHDIIRHFTESAISHGAHRFLKVDKNTGQIIGALAGNVIFKKGGKNNSLGGVGKIVLDNILSGKFNKKVTPLVHQSEIRRTAGIESFGLDFYKERDRCLKQRQLFEDPEFPASSKSLYFKRAPAGRVEWRRPGEIVHDPCLIVEGHTRFDVVQGSLGDCWLLAAIANLTLRDELFYRVVPPDQSFTDNYAGIFHFQFWRYGRWVDVVIDDRLPTVNGKLIYMHSGTVNEFWSALLEKAYAKLYTCYECLDGGLPMDALEDFTGGLTEHIELRKIDKATLLALLVRGFQMGSMFCCSLEADPNTFEAQLPNGLIRGHAYSITAVQEVSTSRGTVLLLRVRNPWGNNKEWYGPWSDGSREWQTVSRHDKEKLEVRFNEDGEFWMSFDDFSISFETLEVCNLSASVMGEIEMMTGVRQQQIQEAGVWQEQQCDGAWSRERGTAGGCINFIATFARNPQFLVQLTNARNSVEGDGNCTVIVAVLQKFRREMKNHGKENLPIGFSVYRAPPNFTGKLDERFFRTNRSVAKVPVFVNMREVTARFRVPPGQYIVIPCTFEPHESADFLLRVFSNGDAAIREIF
ncbi:unnamed protein product, partial [Mesorhabditis spiculigera]